MNTISKPQYCSIQQACEIIQVSRPTIYRLFEQGKLTAVKIGSVTRIKLSEIEKLK